MEVATTEELKLLITNGINRNVIMRIEDDLCGTLSRRALWVACHRFESNYECRPKRIHCPGDVFSEVEHTYLNDKNPLHMRIPYGGILPSTSTYIPDLEIVTHHKYIDIPIFRVDSLNENGELTEFYLKSGASLPTGFHELYILDCDDIVLLGAIK